MATFKDKLFDLISEHEDFDALLFELTEKEPFEFSQKILSKPTFIGLFNLIQERSSLTSSALSSTSAVVLSTLLKTLVGKSESQLFFGDPNDKISLSVLIDVGKHFIAENQFDQHVFTKKVSKEADVILPFEAIWMLHNSKLMTLDLFFVHNLKHPAAINSISSNLALICIKDNLHEIDLRKCILSGIVTSLLKLAFVESSDSVTAKGLKKISLALIDRIWKQLLLQQDQEHDIYFFSVLTSKLVDPSSDLSLLGKETMKKFFARQINIILTKSSDKEFLIMDELSHHRQWTYIQMNKNLRSHFEELLVLIDAVEFFNIFKKFLEQRELDWGNGLMFLSVALVCFPDLIELVEGMSFDLFHKSLRSSDRTDLASSFLIFRHCCCQGSHIYMPYHLLFKKLFKDENIVISGKKSLLFFIKFLTEIMPFESEEFIRVRDTVGFQLNVLML